MRVWIWVGVLASAALLACTDELPPTGQVLLYVDTDAPLPPGPGVAPTFDEPPALFDTLLVDVFEPGQRVPCPRCTRSFALTATLLRELQASFGLPLKPDVSGYRARLRLYHSDSTLTGTAPEPGSDGTPPQSVIDVTVQLPRVPEEGIVERAVFLPTDAVGIPIGSLEAPERTSADPPAQSLVGTWPGAQRVPCAGEPQDGEVCIPGGAFWMGHPYMRGTGLGDASDRRRLVVLSPFYMDATEVTVAQFRESPASPAVFHWSGNTSGDELDDYCTFTITPGPHEQKPVMCLSIDSARAYCEARGAGLPTTAQFEYVAGALESRLFVWGRDYPSCEDAVFERVGYGMLSFTRGACMPAEPPGGGDVVGSFVDPPRRDRVELPTGTLYDFVGNAAEYTLDVWNRQTEPCWSAGGVYYDPLCLEASPADGNLITFRGGTWFGVPRYGAAAHLHRTGRFDVQRFVGIRCVRPAL